MSIAPTADLYLYRISFSLKGRQKPLPTQNPGTHTHWASQRRNLITTSAGDTRVARRVMTKATLGSASCQSVRSKIRREKGIPWHIYKQMAQMAQIAHMAQMTIVMSPRETMGMMTVRMMTTTRTQLTIQERWTNEQQAQSRAILSVCCCWRPSPPQSSPEHRPADSSLLNHYLSSFCIFSGFLNYLFVPCVCVCLFRGIWSLLKKLVTDKLNTGEEAFLKKETLS
mmetsp:Transcript_12326/g.29520  ORF Transcript_12326/g.29520 Transcript_12326/m.29520 type:complete len:226 (+) Transcript_12326:389-1066(+)